MLTYSEVKELSAISGDENYFVSLYLNVNPVTNPKGDYLIHFKNMLKQTLDNLDKKIGKSVNEDLERIEAFIKDNKRGFKKGVSVISSAPRGIWKDFHVSLPVKNELVIDSTPYVKPLLALLDNYQRCMVLLVDKETARV
ncbi:MAG TPA: hypothetical protein ENH04_06095, partial [Nitrospirae bacterium]|nr:hypothetical protein [Nitrospirota bacterium]